MPNLMDGAQRLTRQPLLALLLGERCLSERDLSASCTTCADACPTGAIAFAGAAGDAADPYGSVTKDESTGPIIDAEACTRCGRCVVACPTAALAAVSPFDDDALLDESARIASAARERAARTRAEREAREGAEEAGEGAERSRQEREVDAAAIAGFACAAVARTRRLDAERTATLPCLAWVDETLLVHAACAGARRVDLLTGACAACEQAAAIGDLPSAAARAQAIADAWGIEATFSLVDAGDGGLSAAEAPAAGEVSRRNLLAQARSALADAATDAFASPLRDFAGLEFQDDAPAPEPDRRRWQLLDDLHAHGLPDGGAAVVPRCLAPRVDVDVERCSGCALCAQFCPTGALRKAGKAPGGKTVLEFDAALCRDCGICTATCRYEALSCEGTLTAAELFAFEPREIVIPKRRVLPSRR